MKLQAIKKFLDTVVPSFVRLPLLLAVGTNMLTYYLVPILLGENIHRYDLAWMSAGLDDWLPFVPFFVLFYALAFAQWGFSYIFHCRESAQLCYRMVVADIIAKLICLVCFVLLPTEIVRPEITGNSIWEWATGIFYATDKPINLFPSIHCLESWICFRTAMMMEKRNGWYITAQGILTVLVMASTVLIKQHFVIDIPAGVLVVEIGLFLSDRCGLWRVLRKVETPAARRAIAQRNADPTQL